MAKQNGLHLAPALVKRMLDKGMFLFGYMNLLDDDSEKQIEELTALQNKRVRFACDKYVIFSSVMFSIRICFCSKFHQGILRLLSQQHEFLV